MLQTLLNSLKIEPMILLINGILFIVLLHVLDRIFWRPVMKHLEARRESIAGAYKAVEDTRREMENLRTDYQNRLAKIETEARGRIQSTVREAQHQREELINQARAEADEIMRKGAESIGQEKEQAVVSMREQLDDVALVALTKAAGVAPDPAQRKLVDEYIAQHVVKS